MRIFHIATVADWDAARAAGRYTTSTRGRTLAEEGFIHASRGDQWQAVRERWYADVTEPLVLLVLDTALLTSPVVDEHVPGSTETFPHVYGPIDVAAVVRTIPLDGTESRQQESASFSRIYFQELRHNVVVACAVMGAVVVATLAGLAVDERWGPIGGAALGLSLGVLGVRRWGRRTRP